MRVNSIEKIDATLHACPFRHYDFTMAAFVMALLLSDVLGAGKVATMPLAGVGDRPSGAGVLFFPIGRAIGGTLVDV